MRIRSIDIIVVISLLLFAVQTAKAELYTGVLLDSVSSEPMFGANIVVEGTTLGTSTNIDGSFEIEVAKGQVLICSYIGYHSKRVMLDDKTNLRIRLAEDGDETVLQELVVNAGKYKYNKKNEAVDFITKAIARRDSNSIDAQNYYERKIYEKTTVGITDIKIKDNNRHGLDSIYQEMDTSVISGKPVMFFSLNEKQIDQYYRGQPQTRKNIINGINRVGLDSDVLPDGALNQFTDQFFKDIDIYQGSINIAFKSFVGPLSKLAPNFYMFFIRDTVVLDGLKCVEISFAPLNNAMMGFIGELCIVDPSLADSGMVVPGYAVKRAELRIHKEVAINWLDGMKVVQNFKENEHGIMEVTDENISAEFYVIQKLNGMYTERLRQYSAYQFGEPNDSILRSIEGYELVRESATEADSTFWATSRSNELRENENNIGPLVSAMNRSGGMRTFFYVLETVIKAYLRTSKPSYFDIGPIYTFIGGGDIEGFRLKFAGETTANLCPYVFLSGYGAYGFKDKQWKFQGQIDFSFNKKNYHPREWPVNGVQLSYTRDTKTLGEDPVYTTIDNMFYAIKRMGIKNVVYYDKALIKYEYEHKSGFSLKLIGFQEWMRPSDWLGGTISFQQVNGADTLCYDVLKRNEIGLTLRYAPHETFVQGRLYRFPTKNKWPEFTLSHRASFKDLFGSPYGYQATEFRYAQKFFFAAYGRMDLWIKTGKIWTNDVPYPYLFSPNANTSFTVVNESFSLANPLEFVADQYASVDVMFYTYLLFNSIPGVKKAHLREVFGFKAYWGYLSPKNDPYYNPEKVMLFPKETMTLNPHEPYMEFSVGIENIFNLIRLEYVRRINYLDSPSIRKNPMGPNGIRFVFDFEF